MSFLKLHSGATELKGAKNPHNLPKDAGKLLSNFAPIENTANVPGYPTIASFS